MVSLHDGGNRAEHGAVDVPPGGAYPQRLGPVFQQAGSQPERQVLLYVGPDVGRHLLCPAQFRHQGGTHDAHMGFLVPFLITWDAPVSSFARCSRHQALPQELG